jgi:hypothetical protein
LKKLNEKKNFQLTNHPIAGVGPDYLHPKAESAVRTIVFGRGGGPEQGSRGFLAKEQRRGTGGPGRWRAQHGALPQTPSVSVAAVVVNAKQGTFKITWTTNEPTTSTVTFTAVGAYSDSALVTSHSMNFRGTKGATYTFTVSSADAAGNVATSGTFTHQN